MPSLPNEKAKTDYPALELYLHQLLCKRLCVSEDKLPGAIGHAGRNCNELEQPEAWGCFEGRKAVELSILMGDHK